MAADAPDTPRLKQPLADLERALIDNYLRTLGHDPDALGARDDIEAHRLLAEASTYAAGKLTEVESRAHYIDEIHHVIDEAPRTTRRRSG
jgi:hypothetical protein